MRLPRFCAGGGAGHRAVSSQAGQVTTLCGPLVDPEEARRGLESIRELRTEEVADRLGIGRAGARRLIPAIVVHGALAEAFGRKVEPVAEDPVAGRAWLAEAERPLAGRRPG